MFVHFVVVVVCFFKQKTAYEMRISDWSSDVCSSDLVREFSTEYDRRYAAEVQQAFNQGATRQQLDAIAAKYSAPSFGPDLDQAIRARDAGAQSIQFSTPVSGRESTG